MLLVDVILPLPLDRLFTYSVSDNFSNIQVGGRVIVQFGKKKYYTAIVVRIYDEEPKDGIKEIVSILDDTPSVLPSQLEFWKWISSYYMCSLGDVCKAALPSVLKLESETYITRNEDFEHDVMLTTVEQNVFYALPDKQALKVSELEKKLKISNVISHIKSLSDKKAIRLSENLKDNYVAKTEMMIQLAQNFSERELHLYLDGLGRAKKQQQLLSLFLHLKKSQHQQGGGDFSISKKELLKTAQLSSLVLDGLVNRGILKAVNTEISRFDYGETNLDVSNKLNPHQEEAYKSIYRSFEEKSVVLLHGVTSSGKTEIYIQLIKDAINKGLQVLYLLPEIALTTQITERLKTVFGNKLLVYHSKFNDNERGETWKTLLDKGEAKVVLGARSAIFLPFTKLGLIIVDEEHESSYKQQDPAPRYNARNAAIVLAAIYQAKTLLGTATPSVESYYNATLGKYGLVQLTKRFDDIELPQILPVNTKELRRKKQMKHILSPPLINEITEALNKKEQVILFQNRRGFAPLLECKTCSWTPVCEHCDVSLTYHKGQRNMVCHYCGAIYEIPALCPNCETPTLEILGYGTERIEEEVKELFPEASVVRMDLDTTRSRRAYEKIIFGLENGETDILIGTQMISKGLDFDNVSIVGILNADNSLNYPDFRAHEKTFQLMTQVSGRAGRKNRQGLVMLQTSHPSHPVVANIVNCDYEGLYSVQIEERKLFRYPPFYRLISIILKGKDENLLNNAAKQFASSLTESLGERVLGPTKPPVSRVQSLHIRHILLKIENDTSPQKIREAIKFHQQKVFSKPENRSVLVYFDVDPLV